MENMSSVGHKFNNGGVALEELPQKVVSIKEAWDVKNEVRGMMERAGKWKAQEGQSSLEEVRNKIDTTMQESSRMPVEVDIIPGQEYSQPQEETRDILSELKKPSGFRSFWESAKKAVSKKADSLDLWMFRSDSQFYIPKTRERIEQLENKLKDLQYRFSHFESIAENKQARNFGPIHRNDNMSLYDLETDIRANEKELAQLQSDLQLKLKSDIAQAQKSQKPPEVKLKIEAFKTELIGIMQSMQGDLEWAQSLKGKQGYSSDEVKALEGKIANIKKQIEELTKKIN